MLEDPIHVLSGQHSEPNPIIVATTRRVWSDAEKRVIVAQTESMPVAEVARRVGIAPNLLSRWRRQFGKDQLGDGEQHAENSAAPAFVPVTVPALMAPPVDRAPARLEIDLVQGHRLRVNAPIEIEMLERLIDALVGR